MLKWKGVMLSSDEEIDTPDADSSCTTTTASTNPTPGTVKDLDFNGHTTNEEGHKVNILFSGFASVNFCKRVRICVFFLWCMIRAHHILYIYDRLCTQLKLLVFPYLSFGFNYILKRVLLIIITSVNFIYVTKFSLIGLILNLNRFTIFQIFAKFLN